MSDLAAAGRAIVDASLYMVLGTADLDGRPWATPVYYAHLGYREFVWISSPEAAHSHNLLDRPEVAIVVFDSSVPIGTGQGVYMSAQAEELAADEAADAIEAFSRRSGSSARPTSGAARAGHGPARPPLRHAGSRRR